MKHYYIEGTDQYSDATEGITKISKLEMYKALRLAKRITKTKTKKLPQDCKPLKWKVLNFFLYRPLKMYLKLICLGKFTGGPALQMEKKEALQVFTKSIFSKFPSTFQIVNVCVMDLLWCIARSRVLTD